MRKLTALFIAFFALIQHYSVAQSPIERIEPPHWYKGMESPKLQLLIYGDDISEFSCSVDETGVSLISEERLANPNYLFVNLEISEEFGSNEFDLLFKKGRKKIKKSYSLLTKNTSEERGLDQSDLIYLVFPDRFANGDESNDQVKGMHDMSLNRDSMFHRHGGDIRGIIDHLDYIENLGATAIWINPLIENNEPEESYHGYAATDLYKIDPRFGSNEDYLELSKECKKHNLKLIKDVVLNHWGDKHWIIQDLPDSSWLNNWDEFTRTTYRAPTLFDPYASEADRKLMSDGWFDHHMPDLNQRSPLLANYLIQNHLWWIEYAGIDAFRIDTYAYPDQEFMVDWAKRIQKEYPDLFMFGETWVHGTPVQASFVENSFPNTELRSAIPSVTDFQLHYAINNALNEDEGWTEGSMRLYYTLAKDIIYPQPEKLVTFVDNHDLSRFYSVIKEDLNSFKMGIGFMMTTRGIPSLYYGTEILLKNFADPDGKVRQDFPGGWANDTINKFSTASLKNKEKEAFEFIQQLANWRKNNIGLVTGELIQFVPKDGVYTYFRIADERALMVNMNFNASEKEIETGRFKEIIGNSSDMQNLFDGTQTKLENGKLKLEPRCIKMTIIELE